MIRTFVLSALLILLAASAHSGDEPAKMKKGDKLIGGMSIVGNDDSPKSLAIVPWKGSELGETLNAIRALDAG